MKRIGLLVASVAVAACGHTRDRSDAGPPSFRTLSAVRAVTNEQDLTARVTYGAGKFQLAPAPEGQLYHVNLVYDEHRFSPVTDYDADDHTLRVGIRAEHSGHGNWDLDQQKLELALNPSIPTNLTLELGAVEASMDLGDLSLRDVTIKNGASDTKIRFAEPNRTTCDRFQLQVGAAALEARGLGNAHCGRYDIAGGVGDLTLAFDGDWAEGTDARVELKVGVGSVTLELPRSVGATITLSKFLADFTISDFTKQGDRYVSNNYETASSKLDIDLKAAFGDVTVRWLDVGK